MDDRGTAYDPLRSDGSLAGHDGAVDVTLLFCDVVRSTELIERLGDRAAYARIRRFHETVVQCSHRCEGTPLEVRGDGVFVAFQEPRHGLACAIQIQRSLAVSDPLERLEVRIGVHAGPALRIPVGYFGATVNLSARIAACAGPGEILVSAAVRDRLQEPDRYRFDAERRIALKGFLRPSRLFGVAWERETGSAWEACPSPGEALHADATLRHGESAAPSGMLGGAGLVPG